MNVMHKSYPQLLKISGEGSSLNFGVHLSESSTEYDSSSSVLNLYLTTVDFQGENFSGIGVWGYRNERDETSAIFGNTMIKIDSLTEIYSSQSYIERTYLIPRAMNTQYNSQQSLFGTCAQADEAVIFLLAESLSTFCNTTSGASVSVNINFSASASEEQKIVITGLLQNYSRNLPEAFKKTITWVW